MRIFQEVQKNLYSLGLSPELKPFYGRNLSLIAITFPTVVLQWILLIQDANDVQTYLESIYAINTCTGVFICFISTSLDSMKLFSFIKHDEEFVNESK